jgi:hypothetical protein
MDTKLLFNVYLLVLAMAVLKGLYRYKRLDTASRYLLLLLFITTVSEFICLVRIENKLGKAPVYHIYNVIEIILTTAYFLKTIRSYHFSSLMLATVIVWPTLGILNCIFFQPLNKFNSNILLLESICIIAMSLYSLYKMLLNDTMYNVLKYPHFWIWSIQLIYWSSSFFFWGYYEVLMQKGWKYMESFAVAQAIINILVYIGIGLTLLFFPKQLQQHEHR